MKKREKFKDIYDKYIEKIYRFVFLKVGSKEIAEDLTSEVFTRGWKAFNSNSDIKNIQAFLYQIAKNLIADFYRKESRIKMVSMPEQVEDPKPNPNDKLLLNSDLNEVQKALPKLKEDYQNVIIWRYLDELSTKEVAQMMGKSEGAVRVLLHRALKSLKEEIE